MAYRGKRFGREITGMIGGFVILAILVAISYALGKTGVLSVASGDIVFGLLIAGAIGYGYTAMNRKRSYAMTVGIMSIGYIIGAFVLEPLYPEGAFITNLATASTGVAFMIYIFLGLFLLIVLLTPFYYAKRTQLH